MTAFLDTYVKLIIAFISFIAPLIVYLLSVFSEGAAVHNRKSREENSQITDLLKLQIATSSETIDVELFNRSNKLLQANQKNGAKTLQLLSPHRQIVRIFLPLFIALALIMADDIVKDPAFNLYNHWVSVALIGLSFLSFGIGIFFLKQVAWAIIDTKRILGFDKSAVSVRPIMSSTSNQPEKDTF